MCLGIPGQVTAIDRDADGPGVRGRVRFGGIRKVQGRPYPHVWTVRPQGEEESESRIEVARSDDGNPPRVNDRRHFIPERDKTWVTEST